MGILWLNISVVLDILSGEDRYQKGIWKETWKNIYYSWVYHRTFCNDWSIPLHHPRL